MISIEMVVERIEITGETVNLSDYTSGHFVQRIVQNITTTLWLRGALGEARIRVANENPPTVGDVIILTGNPSHP